jgi:hypothetical protein
MMALIAIFDTGFFVVGVVGEDRGRSLGAGEGIRGYDFHILLGPSVD